MGYENIPRVCWSCFILQTAGVGDQAPGGVPQIDLKHSSKQQPEVSGHNRHFTCLGSYAGHNTTKKAFDLKFDL